MSASPEATEALTKASAENDALEADKPEDEVATESSGKELHVAPSSAIDVSRLSTPPQTGTKVNLYQPVSKVDTPTIMNPHLLHQAGSTVVGIYMRNQEKTSWNPSAASLEFSTSSLMVAPDRVMVLFEKCSDKGEVTYSAVRTDGGGGREAVIFGATLSETEVEVRRFVREEANSDKAKLTKVFYRIENFATDTLVADIKHYLEAEAPQINKGPALFQVINGVFERSGCQPIGEQPRQCSLQ